MAPVLEIHPPSDQDIDQYLIFFFTGNPGFIAYYKDFFETLHTLLQASTASSNKIFHLVGRSLAGFEDHDNPLPNPPYSLDQESAIIRNFLSKQRIPSGSRKDQHYKGVILIGHSVGSYILLELLRQSKLVSEDPADGDCRNINIVAGICLFPTVTHIAKSPSGLKISSLFRIPHFPRIASFVAKLLIFPLPRGLLRFIVRSVTGMPDAGVNTTMQFLESEKGIWQALHLARDEMESIKEDKWDEDIWGIENPQEGSRIPKLIFYFGQNDHWVADHTRDEFIAARGQAKGDTTSKPLMLIDQGGIPHGFCLNHSETVAEKVKVWIDDIVGEF